MKITYKTVFEDTADGGYNYVRIPGIAVTDDGTIFAYYECRTGSDWSAIDIGMRKSTDGGRTWSERRILVSGRGRNTVNNPVMIADGNVLHFLYCENYKRIFHTQSTDCGETWSAPAELTDEIDRKVGRFWSVCAVGPCHGIKLGSGRLAVPMWFAYNRSDIFAHHPSFIKVLYSDDGINWSLSETIGKGILTDPSECCIAECGGRIVLNIRNENDCRLRAISESTDCVHWSEPKFAENLIDPVCCAGMCSNGEKLCFSNCASQTERNNLTVKCLDGKEKTVSEILVSEDGGYSDINFYKNLLYVVYEQDDNKALNFAEIEL